MKYLQEEGLAALTACMTEASPTNTKNSMTSNRLLFGRIEAFTTKRARMEKLMAQEVSERYWNQDEQLQEEKHPSKQRRRRSQSVSSIQAPPVSILKNRSRSSSLDVSLSFASNHHRSYKRSNQTNSNSIKNTWCRRTYTDLVLTLQASFPDYDFSNIPPDYFVKLPSVRLALFRIQEKLADYTTTNTNSFVPDTTISGSCSTIGSNPSTLSMDSISSCLNQVLTDHSKKTNNHNQNTNNNMNKMVEVYSFCPPWEWQGDDDAPTTNHFLTESLVVTSSSINSNNHLTANGHSSTSHESIHTHNNITSNSSLFTHITKNSINENDGDEWQIILPSAYQSSSTSHNNSPGKNHKAHHNSESLVPLWNFNYFFVNKTLKRIVLFTCVETIMTPGDSHMGNEDDHDDVNVNAKSANYYDTDSSSVHMPHQKNLGRHFTSSGRNSNHVITPSEDLHIPFSRINSNMKQYHVSKSSFTDTASFSGYYSVTDDDHDPIREEEDNEEEEEEMEFDDAQDEDNHQSFWKDDYDMDGDAMGKEAPPVTVI